MPTATATATVTVNPPPPVQVARTVGMSDGVVTYGSTFNLTSVTNGDGAPVYSVVSGPGAVSGDVLSVSSVGTIQVRADYPATPGYTAGSATAMVTVVPKPVTFTLADQDFDYDGAAKTASFTVSDPAALAAGMVNLAGLTAGPSVNRYTVSVSAFGNYTGAASATVQIWPRITAFVFQAPPAPQIAEFEATNSVQWPANASLRWRTQDARTVTLRDEKMAEISSATNGTLSLPTRDARSTPYTYEVTATARAGTATMSAEGATTARLQGPGLDVDVTGTLTYPIDRDGTYTYTVSANGLSRTGTFEARFPSAAIRSADVRVLPATVTGTWAARLDLEGPYTVTSSDLPTWTIQTGDAVDSASTLVWTRSDDSGAGSAIVGDVLMPGSYRLTAAFVPPNTNYGPATVSADWALTVPLSITTSNASVSINGITRPSGMLLRFLPGTVILVAATPLNDFGWGTEWTPTRPEIWQGTSTIIPDTSAPSFTTVLPAGVPRLTLSATAYQLAPRVTELTPVASSYTVSTGPLAGRSYPRTWQTDGTWRAYLARDGVTFKVTGASRESAVREFELQGRGPGGSWATLGKTAPPDGLPNGPRIQLPVTFSLRLGESNPQKPLMPADLKQAGTWEFRARVQSTAGNWSDWSDVQPVLAVVPLQTVTLQGRTLPPVQDADWFTASAPQSYPLQVWVP